MALSETITGWSNLDGDHIYSVLVSDSDPVQGCCRWCVHISAVKQNTVGNAICQKHMAEWLV